MNALAQSIIFLICGQNHYLICHIESKKTKQSYADMPAESAGVLLGQIRLVIAVQFKY